MKTFIEGPSFVGKTTLINALSESDPLLRVMGEHDLYANGIDNFPPFPSATYVDAVENVRFFCDLEKIRSKDSLSGEMAVFDRSIFSIILFQKFIKSLNLEHHAYAYSYAKDEATRLIQSNSIAIPDYIVCIGAEYATVAKRHDRDISVELLRGEAAHAFFQKDYNIIASIYEKYGKCMRIILASDSVSFNNQVDAVSEQMRLQQQKNNTPGDAKEIALETIDAI